jgi:hypothetical protein
MSADQLTTSSPAVTGVVGTGVITPGASVLPTATEPGITYTSGLAAGFTYNRDVYALSEIESEFENDGESLDFIRQVFPNIPKADTLRERLIMYETELNKSLSTVEMDPATRQLNEIIAAIRDFSEGHVRLLSFAVNLLSDKQIRALAAGLKKRGFQVSMNAQGRLPVMFASL